MSNVIPFKPALKPEPEPELHVRVRICPCGSDCFHWMDTDRLRCVACGSYVKASLGLGG